jgi:iron complex transport system substrate-binding protein
MSLRSIAVALAALSLFGAAVMPADARDFTDAAGRHVVLPDQIRRVMPAGPAADVLVFVVAPNRLIGWSVPHKRDHLPAKVLRLPVTGQLTEPNPTVGADAIRRLHPDVVVDVGEVTPERAAFADQMQQQSGIPYILVDDTIIRTPATLRSIGATLGEVDRGQDLSRYSRRAIETLHGRLLIRPADNRPTVYYGRGSDGLEAALPGSPAGDAIDQAGALNASAPLGRDKYVRITRDQLMSWNPDIIIAEEPAFYDWLARDRSARQLSAVRSNHYYLMPSAPFGWIDDPPGVNRMIGLYWLSAMFYPDPTQDDVRTIAADLYEKFYGIKLTEAQVDALVRRAGVAKSDTTVGIPLAGLTGAPALAMPPTTETTPPTVVPGLPPPGRRGNQQNTGSLPNNFGPLPNAPAAPPTNAPTNPLPR